MKRESYFKKIDAIKSPLLLLQNQLENIVRLRTDDLIESSTDSYISFANDLSDIKSYAAKSRAEFIKLQCNNIDSHNFFEEHRESWGIPKFEEGLITVDDFKKGFLWTFRDHSTSWCEDNEARHWFFNNIEAQFARHYQFWACDEGPNEILFDNTGDYKSILWTMVREYQDYSALASPIFTKQDLIEFYDNFDEEERDYYKEDLLEMIEGNPNW